MRKVTNHEVQEMKSRYAAGESINYISYAMERDWATVKRYVFDKPWTAVRAPCRSASEHREYLRLRALASRKKYREWRQANISNGYRK